MIRQEGVRWVLPALLLLLIVVGALLGGARGEDGPAGSAFTTEPDGRRVIYRLLGRLGFDARAWTSEPGRLGNEAPAAGSMVVLARVPPEPLVQGTRADEEIEGGPEGRGLRDQRHYLRYLEEGGTIVCHARASLLEFFATTLELPAVANLEEAIQDAEADEEAGEVFLSTGEELALDWPLLPALDDAWSDGTETRFEILLADENERPVALSLEIGRGQLILLSPEEDPLRNEEVRGDDAALALVRLAEFHAPSGPVYFDEYALGLWAPQSPLELALAPGTWLFTVHFLLLGLLLLWRAAWVGPFQRDPEEFENISPLVRARGYAGMLQRHRRYDVLCDLLRRGILRRLARRVGLRGEDAEFGGALEEEHVARILTLLVPAAGADRRAHERARSLILDEVPGEAEGFERLGRELARLEQALLEPAFESGERLPAR